MKKTLSIILILATTASFGQRKKVKIENASIQLINDIITSTDFTFQKNKLAEAKKDTTVKLSKRIPDSVRVDTVIKTKFRLSMADWTEIAKDTFNILDRPYFNTTKEIIPAKEGPDFTSADIKYMRSQLRVGQRIKWDKRIKATIIVSKIELSSMFRSKGTDEGWKMYDLKFGQNLAKFSVPLFNKDLTKAILIIDYKCGPFCGYGGEFLCQKINGKWVIVRAFGSTWAS